MALPRRAMEQMGFAICCLMCDAKDIAGSVRCRDCINNHAKSREKLNQGPPKSKADRLAREFITMLTNPSKHIDDSNHGNSMIYYSSLIDKHNGISPAKTAEEIGKRFKEFTERYYKEGFDDAGRGLDEEALAYAREATYTNELTGFTKKFQEAVNEYPVLKQLFPFSTIELKGRYFLNLRKKVEEFCNKENIAIEIFKECTICDENYFSFRETSTSQRQLGIIWQ